MLLNHYFNKLYRDLSNNNLDGYLPYGMKYLTNLKEV